MSVNTNAVLAFPKIVDLITKYLNPKPQQKSQIELLVQQVFEESQKPLMIIFLGINGVLSDGLTMHLSADAIEKKLAELFKKRVIERASGGKELLGYTELEHLSASSHFFHKPAVNQLQKIIDEAEKVCRVGIVISCPRWEINSVKELREQVFAPHKFASYILDTLPAKTDQLQTKASRIRFWLLQNWGRLNICNYTILSSENEGLSEKFPRQFLFISSRFLRSHHQKGVSEFFVRSLASKEIVTQGEKLFLQFEK